VLSVFSCHRFETELGKLVKVKQKSGKGGRRGTETREETKRVSRGASARVRKRWRIGREGGGREEKRLICTY